MGTLRAGNGNEAGGVPFLEAEPVAFHTTQDPIDGPISPCLSQGNQQGHCTTGVLTQTRVRRLTPTECERLQGFPDGWTDIKRSLPNKKLRKHQLISPDGPRYRALGNSMTTSVIAWIGRQIDAAAKGAP
jgi:site-specific DNA-cytosine methylase